jgi:hypothetical protein
MLASQTVHFFTIHYATRNKLFTAGSCVANLSCDGLADPAKQHENDPENRSVGIGEFPASYRGGGCRVTQIPPVRGQ